ncbi:hypothetical protein C8Q78DRAFT_942996, partial [Trametes maxima]
RDYALLADGAMVLDELTSPLDTSNPVVGPHLALDEDSRIGRCWRFPGSSGQLGIITPEFIRPTHVSIEHIPRVIAADIGQAPRRMVLWGVVDGLENEELCRKLDKHRNDTVGPNHPSITGDDYSFIQLAEFVYNITEEHVVQTYPVRSDIGEVVIDIGLFVLEIVENWGGASTCLYCVRIHGVPSD